MDNDGAYVVKIGPVSLQAMKVCPKEVFPFEYQGIELFSHEFELAWRVTEKTTGLLFGRGDTREDAEMDAKANINTMGADWVKYQIEAVEWRVGHGDEYDPETHTWKTKLIQEVGDSPDD